MILGKRLACGDHNTEVVCDPSDPVIDEAQFDAKNWASMSMCTWLVFGNCLPMYESQEAKALRMEPRWMLILPLTL
jgi:hypothetical protein